MPGFVWPGVTAGYQASAVERVFTLCRLKARVRVVSVEPMLGPVNLRRLPGWFDPVDGAVTGDGALTPDGWTCSYDALQGRAYVGRGFTVGSGGRVGWVIAGCESGPHRRPTETAAVRDLRDQCARSRTPFFLKQLDVGGVVTEEPELDGRRHVEFPG